MEYVTYRTAQHQGVLSAKHDLRIRNPPVDRKPRLFSIGLVPAFLFQLSLHLIGPRPRNQPLNTIPDHKVLSLGHLDILKNHQKSTTQMHFLDLEMHLQEENWSGQSYHASSYFGSGFLLYPVESVQPFRDKMIQEIHTENQPPGPSCQVLEGVNIPNPSTTQKNITWEMETHICQTNTAKLNKPYEKQTQTKQRSNQQQTNQTNSKRTYVWNTSKSKNSKKTNTGSSDSSDYQNTTNQAKQWSTNHQNPKIKFLLAFMEWHSSSHSTNLRLRTLRCSSFCNLSRATCIIVVHGERKMLVTPMIHPDHISVS